MTNISREQAADIVSSRGWLPLVPESFRSDILRHAVLQHFAAGAVIYRLGDPLGGIYGLVTGIVTVNVAPAEHMPQLIHLGVAGAWTGEGCFLTRQPRRLELRALVATSMMHVPLEALDRLAAKDANVVRYIALNTMMGVDILIQVVHDLQRPDAARRIAAVLHRATSIGQVPIPLTQAEIGAMANASRKQVNAALQRFAAAGWISNTYRSITIIAPEQLRRFASETDAG